MICCVLMLLKARTNPEFAQLGMNQFLQSIFACNTDIQRKVKHQQGLGASKMVVESSYKTPRRHGKSSQIIRNRWTLAYQYANFDEKSRAVETPWNIYLILQTHWFYSDFYTKTVDKKFCCSQRFFDGKLLAVSYEASKINLCEITSWPKKPDLLRTRRRGKPPLTKAASTAHSVLGTFFHVPHYNSKVPGGVYLGKC